MSRLTSILLAVLVLGSQVACADNKDDRNDEQAKTDVNNVCILRAKIEFGEKGIESHQQLLGNKIQNSIDHIYNNGNYNKHLGSYTVVLSDAKSAYIFITVTEPCEEKKELTMNFTSTFQHALNKEGIAANVHSFQRVNSIIY